MPTKMKVVICNETCLSIEKGENGDEIKLGLYGTKDSNLDGKPDTEYIILKKSCLDKAIDFILNETEQPPNNPMPL